MHSHRQRGQSTADLLLTMFVLVLLTFGLVHLAFLIVAKHTTSYAAFVTARTAMVHGSVTHAEAQRAERDAMRQFDWPGSSLDAPRPGRRGRRRGVVVPFFMPMGGLLYPDAPARGIPIEGFAMTAIQPDIPEAGDNAGR